MPKVKMNKISPNIASYLLTRVAYYLQIKLTLISDIYKKITLTGTNTPKDLGKQRGNAAIPDPIVQLSTEGVPGSGLVLPEFRTLSRSFGSVPRQIMVSAFCCALFSKGAYANIALNSVIKPYVPAAHIGTRTSTVGTMDCKAELIHTNLWYDITWLKKQENNAVSPRRTAGPRALTKPKNNCGSPRIQSLPTFNHENLSYTVSNNVVVWYVVALLWYITVISTQKDTIYIFIYILYIILHSTNHNKTGGNKRLSTRWVPPKYLNFSLRPTKIPKFFVPWVSPKYLNYSPGLTKIPKFLVGPPDPQTPRTPPWLRLRPPASSVTSWGEQVMGLQNVVRTNIAFLLVDFSLNYLPLGNVKIFQLGQGLLGSTRLREQGCPGLACGMKGRDRARESPRAMAMGAIEPRKHAPRLSWNHTKPRRIKVRIKPINNPLHMYNREKIYPLIHTYIYQNLLPPHQRSQMAKENTKLSPLSQKHPVMAGRAPDDHG